MKNEVNREYQVNKTPFDDAVGADNNEIKAVTAHINSLSENFVYNCFWAQRNPLRISTSINSFSSMDSDIELRYINDSNKELNFNLKFDDLREFLQFCDDRQLRKDTYEKYKNISADSIENENKPIVRELLLYRNHLGRLLGYNNYIDYALSKKSIKSLSAIKDFLKNSLNEIYPQYAKNYNKLEKYAAKKLKIKKLDDSDVWYALSKGVASITQASPWNLDNYFEVARVKNFTFSYVEKLLSLKFIPIESQNENETYIIYDVSAKKELALLELDLLNYYSKDSKRGVNVTIKTKEQDKLPKLSLASNFNKGSKTNTCLMSFGQLTGFFHEMGHVLEMAYTFSNTGSNDIPENEIDALEVYSHFMENFIYDWDFMREMSSHHKSGKKLPRRVFDDAVRCQKFIKSFSLMDKINSSIKELEFNSLDDFTALSEKSSEIEQYVFQDKKNITPNVFYEQSPQLFHIWGKSKHEVCNFYSYLTSEVISRDIFEKFKGNSSLATPPKDLKLREHIFAQRGLVPFAESYCKFTGKNKISLNVNDKYRIDWRIKTLMEKIFQK